MQNEEVSRVERDPPEIVKKAQILFEEFIKFLEGMAKLPEDPLFTAGEWRRLIEDGLITFESYYPGLSDSAFHETKNLIPEDMEAEKSPSILLTVDSANAYILDRINAIFTDNDEQLRQLDRGPQIDRRSQEPFSHSNKALLGIKDIVRLDFPGKITGSPLSQLVILFEEETPLLYPLSNVSNLAVTNREGATAILSMPNMLPRRIRDWLVGQQQRKKGKKK